MAVYYAMIQGPATGTVRNLPSSSAPFVRYFLSRENMATLATALRHLCCAMFAAGAKTLYPSISRYAPLTSEADLNRIPIELSTADTNLMTIHLFSSCPSGGPFAIGALPFADVRAFYVL